MAAEQNIVGQTAPEQPVEQPAVVTAKEVADEDLARDWARASTPKWGMRPRGLLPQAMWQRRKTKPRPLLQLKRAGPRLQLQWRLPRGRALLTEVRVL